MQGMSEITGQAVGGVEHLRQSILDILTTPIGSRVMRRDYGSRLYELIDTPFNAATQLALIAATAEALVTWEPRFLLESVSVQSFSPGRVVFDLVGQFTPGGETIRLEGIAVT